jgi:HD-GYP domain-containing protein (c-di-GMP phosphodiesterase class II)
MTTARPYRDPRTPAEAQAELMADAEHGKFRLELVEAFLRSVDRRPSP